MSLCVGTEELLLATGMTVFEKSRLRSSILNKKYEYLWRPPDIALSFRCELYNVRRIL